jgi:hypothetical protein
MRCVLTDVHNRVPIDMLADRSKGTVAGWINRFKDRQHVRGMAMDMWRPYRDVATLMFPGLPVVIDKFHVVRMANNGLDKVRIRLAKDQTKAVKLGWLRSKVLLNKRPHNLTAKQKFNLDMWLDNEPDIATGYALKEAFYAIYDATSKDAAGNALDDWRNSVPTDMKIDFQELLSATKNWREEILAYFDFPITNGYTEALNGTAKVINPAGRGYTFEVLRARVLFGKRNPFKVKLEPGDNYPEPEPPVVLMAAQTLAPAPAPPRQASIRSRLLREHQNRCVSCHGVYDSQNLYVTRMGPFMEGEPMVNLTLLCAECKKRFHTNEVMPDEPYSTR